jgi:hypothetical protein
MAMTPFQKISLLYLLRSIARVLALGTVILIVLIAAGQGLPDLRSFPPLEVVLFISLVVMLIGLLIGWWREEIGAIMIFSGFAAFLVVERIESGTIRKGGIFMLFPIVGLLYLMYWWQTRTPHAR